MPSAKARPGSRTDLVDKWVALDARHQPSWGCNGTKVVVHFGCGDADVANVVVGIGRVIAVLLPVAEVAPRLPPHRRPHPQVLELSGDQAGRGDERIIGRLAVHGVDVERFLDFLRRFANLAAFEELADDALAPAPVIADEVPGFLHFDSEEEVENLACHPFRREDLAADRVVFVLQRARPELVKTDPADIGFRSDRLIGMNGTGPQLVIGDRCKRGVDVA